MDMLGAVVVSIAASDDRLADAVEADHEIRSGMKAPKRRTNMMIMG